MNKLLILAVLACAGCTSKDGAERALKGAGYTNIETGGYAFFYCAKDDWFATKFKATGPSGQLTQGAVCSGWLKGSTIRSD